jgi:hypothetical protein
MGDQNIKLNISSEVKGGDSVRALEADVDKLAAANARQVEAQRKVIAEMDRLKAAGVDQRAAFANIIQGMGEYDSAMRQAAANMSIAERINRQLAESYLRTGEAVDRYTSKLRNAASVEDQKQKEAERYAINLQKNSANMANAEAAAAEKYAISLQLNSAKMANRAREVAEAEEAARLTGLARTGIVSTLGFRNPLTYGLAGANALGGGSGQGISGAANLLTGGGGAVVGGAIGVAAVGLLSKAMYDLVKSEAEATQELKNFGDRLGLTIPQAQSLSIAAKLVGIDFHNLESAGRLLSAALESPAAAGKKGAEAIKSLGISIRDLRGDPEEIGPVLLKFLQQLSQIPNAVDRIHKANEVLGRGAKTIQPLIADYDELNRVVRELSENIDSGANQKLLAANRAIKEMDESFSLLKRNLAGGLAPIVVRIVTTINDTVEGNHRPGSLFYWPSLLAGLRNENDDMALSKGRTDPFYNPPKPGAPGTMPAAYAASLDADAAKFKAGALRTPEGINRRLSELKALDAKLSGQLSDRLDPSERASQGKELSENQAEEKKLEALLKQLNNPNKKTGAQQLTDEFSRMTGGFNNKAVPESDRLWQQYNEDVRRLQEDPNFKAAGAKVQKQMLNQLLADAAGAIARVADKADAKSELSLDKAKDHSDAAADRGQTAYERAHQRALALYYKTGTSSDEFGDINPVTLGMPPMDMGIYPDSTKSQNRQIASIGMREAVDKKGGTDDPSTHLARAIELQRQLIQLEHEERAEQIGKLETQKDYDALQEADFQRTKSQLELRLDLETKISEIRKTGLEETRSFTEGLFQAGIKGGDAPAQYMRNFGMGIATHIVGNVGQDVLGSLPSLFSLDKGGALGPPGKPNFLGNLLRGTPFGQDPKNAAEAELAKVNVDLSQSNVNLKLSIDNLASIISGNGPTDTSLSGSPTVGGNASLGLPGFQIPGLNLPSSIGTGLGGFGSATTQSWLQSVGGVAKSIPGLGPIGGVIGGIGGIFKGLGNLGGGGSSGGGDSSLPDMGNQGGADNPGYNPLNPDDSGSSPVGSNGSSGYSIGAGNVIGAAGGVVAAVQGFKRGGVSGDLQGVSGVLASAAALTAPIPFVGAALGIASAVTGLVAMFTGKSKEQFEAQQTTLLERDKYEAPTKIDASVDTSGFTTDFNKFGKVRSTAFTGLDVLQQYNHKYKDTYNDIPGGILQPFQAGYTGAQSAPAITIQVQTMDSKSFLDNSVKIAAAVHKELRAGNALGQTIVNTVLGPR